MGINTTLNDNELIYLNEAATAWPLAPGVTDAMLSALSRPVTTAGRGEESSQNSCELCRKAIANSLQVENQQRIILTQNATHSLNIAISGLAAKYFRKVITSVFEHNSVLRPLRYRVEKEGGELIIIGLNEAGDLDFDSIIKTIQDNATLVVLTHASNVSGYLLPVDKIFKSAKQNGALTILDAAQTWGVIPVIPSELSADIIALTGHKGMRGPSGTGALYISEDIDVQPVFYGGTGIWSENEYQPSEMPVRLEIGTPNEHGFAGLNAAIDWNNANQQRMTSQSEIIFNKLIAELKSIPEIKIYGSLPGNYHLPIVSFSVEKWAIEEIGFILEHSFNIKCRTGLHCAPLLHKCWNTYPEGTVRFSLSGMNTENEIDTALAAIRTIIKCGK